MKQKNVSVENMGVFGYGDVYTWTAIDADTKLIPCWQVGTRGAESAYTFIHDLAGRMANRIQLTTDGHKIYADAVEDAFGTDIDYAMLVKHYGNPSEGSPRPAQPLRLFAGTTKVFCRPRQLMH